MKVSLEQPQWLKSYAIGLSSGHRITVFLEGISYAIIKHPGGSFWNGWRNSYCSPWYDIIKKDGKHFWCAFKKEVHSGRMNKSKKLELQKLLERYDNEKLV